MQAQWIFAIVALFMLPKIGDSASNTNIIKRANWLASQGRGEEGLNLLETRMCAHKKSK